MVVCRYLDRVCSTVWLSVGTSLRASKLRPAHSGAIGDCRGGVPVPVPRSIHSHPQKFPQTATAVQMWGFYIITDTVHDLLEKGHLSRLYAAGIV